MSNGSESQMNGKNRIESVQTQKSTFPSTLTFTPTSTSSSKSQITTSDDKEETGKGWTSHAVKTLIHTYDGKKEKFVGSSKKRNKVWIDITDQLKGMGFTFSEKQVKNKFHYLKNKFEKMVDDNKTSGGSRKKWEFFEEMKDLMDDKPNVRLLNASETAISDGKEEENSAADDTLELEDDGPEPDKEPERKKRKNATASDKLASLFDDYWGRKQTAEKAKTKAREEREQKKEEMKDKRHKEKADLLRAMVEALQNKK